jgi:hypothetical protein
VFSATAEATSAAENPIDVPSSLVVHLDGTEFDTRALTVAARLARSSAPIWSR